MLNKNDNTFFTKDIYESDIGLEVNDDVLQRIYSSDITSDTCLSIKFSYVSDQAEKLKKLGLHLLTQFPTYTDFKVRPYNDIFELLGTINPIKMDLTTVNGLKMWAAGYEFDCKLNGWQVRA